jgi:hypothetical protein
MYHRMELLFLKTAMWLRAPVEYTWMLAVIQGLALIFSSYFLYSPPTSGISVAALGLVAVIMAIRVEEKWGRTERVAWLILATVLMMVEVRAIQQEHDIHDREQAAVRRDEREQFQKIANNLTEVLKQNQNHFLQTVQQLSLVSKKQGQVVNLAIDSINATTGGDSYCYFLTGGNGLLALVTEGKFPLYDVSVRAVDLDKFDAILNAQRAQNQPAFQNQLSLADTNAIIGNRIGQTATFNDLPVLISNRDLRFNIFFMARNGPWIQLFRKKQVGGKWTYAFKVTRGKKVLKERVDPDFPKNAKGEIDWD